MLSEPGNNCSPQSLDGGTLLREDCRQESTMLCGFNFSESGSLPETRTLGGKSGLPRDLPNTDLEQATAGAGAENFSEALA